MSISSWAALGIAIVVLIGVWAAVPIQTDGNNHSASGPSHPEQKKVSELTEAASAHLEEESDTDPEPLIDPDAIRSGGVAKDGIPSLTDPDFVTPDEVTWLAPQEPVISFQLKDDVRAYPLQILVWHEIVNDRVGGRPVLVTYCPLCYSSLVFDRSLEDGGSLEFGVSGKLYRSNLVMYDRQTDSLWPQLMGQAVTGPLTGTTLARYPSQIVSWNSWKKNHPRGKVLSRDTGYQRPYGQNPYPGYDDIDKPPFLFNEESDERLSPKARILGFDWENHIVVVPFERLKDGNEKSVTPIKLGDTGFVIFYDPSTRTALETGDTGTGRAVGAAAVFQTEVKERELSFLVRDGSFYDRETGSRWNLFGQAVTGPLKGTQLPLITYDESYWFAWAAFHPESEILP